ncbi:MULTISPECIES: type III secretion system protein PrgM [unclassified Enterococcus]|uniref:type III secretion system protein PrgM n=1 Tax=unclassified Enterococcus TaxID=2608891 RepID=UPI001CE05A3C|nr:MULTISPECIES: type III secretion system protein PrgM [unclassified Enterococcus]
MSKSEDLEKKQIKVQDELNNAKDRLEKQKKAVSKKEAELKQIESELVSALLVENDLTLSDLKSLLSNKPEASDFLEEGLPHEESEQEELGGDDNV